MAVSIKSEEDFARMRVAGAMAAEVLEMIRPKVVPGITTGELDLAICHRYITEDPGCDPGAAELQRLPALDLHLR